jgi:twitching motility protein PilT
MLQGRDLVDYLTLTGQVGGSDLHIAVGSPPMARINGVLHPLEEAPLDAKDCRNLILGSLKEMQRSRLEQDWELDYGITVEGLGRFRGTVCYAASQIEASYRLVRGVIPEIGDLGHGPTIEKFCRSEHGLVLVTGTGGAGKTTTLAAMIQRIARDSGRMIVTIEDPIEYVFPHYGGIIRQRQVGTDTQSFSTALRSALRGDVDVIIVGEMRDLETIRIAMTAAETGHLVLATLHTQDAPSTVSRILDVFPEEMVDYVASQLANSLVGVVCQHLITRKDEGGLVLATEVMVNNSGIAACIRSRRFSQIPGLIQIGGGEGMHTIDDSLTHLMRLGFISLEDALLRCRDKNFIRAAAMEMMKAEKLAQKAKK